jgi:cell fate regulator YaaT (PSP1 superfamily)
MNEEFNATLNPADSSAIELTEVVDVSFRNAGKSYFFSPNGLSLSVGERVIVETSRGLEIGAVVLSNHKIDSNKISTPLRKILRKATLQDIEKAEKNRRAELDAAVICRQKIENHKLEMRLVDAEYTFDNSKLLFYFTAESRVDFRELVKDLASVFRTRIELRQIGIRDEAKMIGGLGACGRPFCCTTFLSDFVQVSIKMAKEQNFSLNSAKISGACGRLMCCLRYEHEIYEAALRKTPPVGSYVSTAVGNGTVIEVRTLIETVKVRLDEKPEAPRLFTVDEIQVLRAGKGRIPKSSDAE